jgi:hypothetical protein
VSRPDSSCNTRTPAEAARDAAAAAARSPAEFLRLLEQEIAGAQLHFHLADPSGTSNNARR